MTTKRNKIVLNKYYNNDDFLEIGVDEAGRGPMLGRVYTGAVILPKTDDFNHGLMKDSKRFSSKKKLNEAAEYIKESAIAWCVSYSTEQEIDKINILNATHKAMHGAITGLINNHINRNHNESYKLLIDGNNFKAYTRYNEDTGIIQIPHVCIEGGDNKYTSIAAASILAKYERDKYIEELCETNPYLDEYYQISKNKGYGTQAHRDGILQNGISEFHRKTFGMCKNYN